MKYTRLPIAGEEAGHPPHRTFNDQYEGPVVCDFNSRFLDLLDLYRWDKDEPLATAVLFELLRKYVGPEDFGEFAKGQERLEISTP